jgi:hypothetical protein
LQQSIILFGNIQSIVFYDLKSIIIKKNLFFKFSSL